MKGLMRKDFTILLDIYRKNLTLVAVLYLVLTIATEMTFFPMMLIWMTCFYALSTITLDESCHWGLYAATLPVSVGQIVGAKLCVSLLFTAAGVVYAILAGGVLAVLRPDTLVFSEYVVEILVVTGVALISTGVLFPCALKWGVDKARNGMLLLYAAVFGGGMLFREQLDGAAAALETVTLEGTQLALGALALGLLACLVGWAAGTRVYAAKEF